MVRADDRGQVHRQVRRRKSLRANCLSGWRGQQRTLSAYKTPVNRAQIVKLQRPLITNICAAFYLSAANQSPDHPWHVCCFHPFVAVIALIHVSTVVRLWRQASSFETAASSVYPLIIIHVQVSCLSPVCPLFTPLPCVHWRPLRCAQRCAQRDRSDRCLQFDRMRPLFRPCW